MRNSKPMSILLIEDDSREQLKFKESIECRVDIELVAITRSSDDGIKYVKHLRPEGIILDLELHQGKGSGMQFLEQLKKIDLTTLPIIVVTTNTPSNLVYNLVRDLGVDIIFYKRQKGYNHEAVVSTLLALRKTLLSDSDDDILDDIQTTEDPWEIRERINNVINVELDLLGISIRYKGREYLEEAIFLLINKEANVSDSVIYQVADGANISYSSVIRAMQTAINNAWSSSDIDELLKHYKARIDVRTGVPSPTEFIYYYANKIKKSM